MKVYSYKNCGTCKKALKYLDEKGIEYKEIAIRETPPSVAELKKVLKEVGELKKLFNTSGQDYRKMDIKSKLPDLSQDEALKLLASNGNLIKRPFVVSKDFLTTGFKQDVWDQVF